MQRSPEKAKCGNVNDCTKHDRIVLLLTSGSQNYFARQLQFE